MLPIFYFKYKRILIILYMKKVIGIFYDAEFCPDSFETGCGGSETWVIQISKEFVKRGYHVIVFAQTQWVLYYNDSLEFFPLSDIESRLNYQHLDYFIFVRCIYDPIYLKLIENGCTNIYLQSHDMFVWEENLYYKKYNYLSNNYAFIKKFVALTNFHKKELYKYNNIPYEKIEVIGNGLDSDIFDTVDKEVIEKDNEILWTSAFGRGGNILIDYILPKVKAVIPDFKVNICGYSDNVPEEIKNNPNVKFLGTLTKEEYYREFKKHKVWFLPCVVVEDFGICAAEAVMCGNHIVSPYLHGMRDVLKPFTQFGMANKYNVKQSSDYHYSKYELEMPFNDFTNTNNEAAQSIIDIINNYDNPLLQKILMSQRKYVMETYTWKNIVDKWIKLFESE